MDKETIVRLLASVSDEPIRKLIIFFLEKNEMLEAENALLKTEKAAFKADNSALKAELSALKEENNLLKKTLYGKKSEKQKDKEKDAAPLFDEHETDEITVNQKKQTITYTRIVPTGRRRKFDCSNLPVRCIIHDLRDEEKKCDCCQETLIKVGQDSSKRLEMIPAQFIVTEHISYKYGCINCQTIKMAPKEKSAIPKAMVGESILAKVVVDKYAYHLPIYRQAKIFSGQNFIVSDYTIGRWVMQIGEALAPLGEALWQEMLIHHYLQIDETPVICLEEAKKAYMWVFACFLNLKPKLVIFDFHLTRSGTVVTERLQSFKGLVQTDGYNGYNNLREQKDIEGLGCGSHARRKFMAVIKLGERSPLADKAITYYEALYKIEDTLREQKATVEERLRVRQSEAKPMLNEFYTWLNENKTSCPPKSTIGKAFAYALDEWPYWSKYIEHGEAEIDTNWVENQIRPFALGRRNWLFIGHEQAGKVGALLYSLIQSALLNDIEPYRYIFYVLHHVHDLRQGKISGHDLLPHRIDRKIIESFVEEHIQKMTALLQSKVKPPPLSSTPQPLDTAKQKIDTS